MTNAQNKAQYHNKKQQLQKSLMPKHIHVQRIDMNNRYLRAQNHVAAKRGLVAVDDLINENAGGFTEEGSILR